MFHLGRYEEAEQFLAKSFREDRLSPDTLMFRIATLAMLNLPLDEEMRELRRSDQRIHRFAWRWRYANSTDWETVAEALRMAGVPENY